MKPRLFLISHPTCEDVLYVWSKDGNERSIRNSLAGQDNGAIDVEDFLLLVWEGQLSEITELGQVAIIDYDYICYLDTDILKDDELLDYVLGVTIYSHFIPHSNVSGL